MRYDTVDRQSGAYSALKEVRQKPEIGVIYRGIVIDNKDPSNTGRVKVSIPSLYGLPLDDKEYLKTKIPWALPCFNSASYHSGSYMVPEEGAMVWVLFENNDIYRPVWMGSMYNAGTEKTQRVGNDTRSALAHQNNVPVEGVNPDHYVVMKTPKGSGLYMNDEEGTVHLYNSKDAALDLDDEYVGAYVSGGGALSLQEDGSYIGTQGGGLVYVSDNSELEKGGAVAVMQRGNNEEGTLAQVKIIEGKSVTLLLGEDKKIVVDEEEDNILIQYDEDKKIIIDGDMVLLMNSSTMATFTDEMVNIKNSNSSVVMEDGMINLNNGGTKVVMDRANVKINASANITIKAGGTIKIDAPFVDIAGFE